MSPRSEQLGVGLGFAGGTTQRTIEGVRSSAAWAADVGFDSYWLSYLIGVDPLVALAVVAPDVPDIELGTSVVPTVGRHPIALAQLARTTQQACAGRFTLGIGPAHQVVVEGKYGEVWDRPVERTSEHLDALVALCNGEPANVDGNQVQVHAELDIESEPVPIVLAALGPKMLELAGAKTAGTHIGQTGPKTIKSHTAPLINKAAEAAGRPKPRIIALVNLSVTDDPAAARKAAADDAAGYASLPSYRAMLDREGISDATDLLLYGSMDDIAAGIEEYVEAGVTDLRLGVKARNDEERDATHVALAEWLASTD